MDEILPTLIGIILLLVTVVLDWPRAVAGMIIGVGARRIGRPWMLIPIGAVVVAGAGELVYAHFGRGGAPSWQSFSVGLIVAVVCAFGLHRVVARMFDGV